MEQARAELPASKGPQLIMLGHVGQSLPSQPVLAELGCCACFNRPTRQAYLRNALAVALAGIPTTLALPHCTLNTGKLQNLHFGPFSNPCLLFCKSHKRDYPLKLLLIADLLIRSARTKHSSFTFVSRYSKVVDIQCNVWSSKWEGSSEGRR
jgi:hypothetical protein